MRLRFRGILKVTLAYLLLINGPILLQDFLTYKSAPFLATLEILKSSLYIFIALFAIFYGLSFNKFLFIFASFILFLFSAVGIYYMSEFGLQITPEIISIMAYNEMEDGFELVSIRVVLWLIFVAGIWG